MRIVLVSSALAVAMLALLLALSVGWAGTVDGWGHAEAVGHRSAESIGVALFVTRDGDRMTALLFAAVATVLVWSSRRPYRWRAGGVVLVGVSATLVARLAEADVVRRLRPPMADWAGPAGGFAFPSGHTTAATVGAAVLAWALCLRVSSRGVRTVIWAVAVLCALGVGWSRVWLGVHWPTDVLGAWCIGALGAALTCHFAGRQDGLTVPSPTPESTPAPSA